MKNKAKLPTGYEVNQRGTVKLAMTGPLLGLAYVVFLPFVGLTACAVAACKRMALAMLRVLQWVSF